jgi:hypothetical protein
MQEYAGVKNRHARIKFRLAGGGSTDSAKRREKFYLRRWHGHRILGREIFWLRVLRCEILKPEILQRAV